MENGDASHLLSEATLNQIIKGAVSDLETDDMEEDDIELTVMTKEFSYNEALNCYFTSDVVQTLTGALSSTEGITDFSYQINDINHTIINKGDIDICSNWCIDDFGLVVGANFITLTAQTDTKEYSCQLVIINANEENMNQTSIDREDDDGDGLINYYEIIFGTDAQNPDTDGDGISDFDEVTRIGTNPALPDTDNNGKLDGEEDFDQDGLTNLEELRYDTNPFSADSDNDGLMDGEEIYIYETDPLLPDTDQDGLRDGAVSYAPRTLETAIKNNITIHCINVADGSSTAMETLAAETNGMYYYATTSEDIKLALAELQQDTIDHMDMTDTDGDGLYDVYETNGMRLSNGQIVYTDPTKADSDGDGINDYEAMGGEPVLEEYRLNGNAYSCTLNHAVVYGKLSPDFIYVDGTINPDGKQYYGEMEYVPFSNEYRFQVYENEKNVTFKGYDDVTVLGTAGVHGSFYHVLADKNWYDILGYFSMAAITQVLIPAYTPSAKYCFYAYMTGHGGLDQGLTEGSTRMYLNSQFVVTEKLFGLNSGNTYLQDNMYSAAKAAEAVLNEYNTEMYLALSPGTVWSGCSYHDTTAVFDMEQNLDALFNLSAFGIYNVADAAVTLHCIYDPDSGVYYMEYIYYLIDFYDFSSYDILYNLDKLGLARAYELYGICPGNVSWHKGDNSYSFYQVLAGEMRYEIQEEQ